MTTYRCKSGCLNCGHFWVTRKRKTTGPPVRCPECGSSKTYVLEVIPTNINPVFGEENYEKMLENMFKDYVKKNKGNSFGGN